MRASQAAARRVYRQATLSRHPRIPAGLNRIGDSQHQKDFVAQLVQGRFLLEITGAFEIEPCDPA